MAAAAGGGQGPVYMGTSEFAATVLERLADSAHRPALVVTPPDRRQGRGRKLSPPPVARLATELGIELHQTKSVNEPASLEAIRGSGADVAVVCAFGQLIKEPLLSEFELLNIHPSLLPRWRGAAPIERAIMAGDERTGVCVMRLTEGLDSGPVALRTETPIGGREDFGSLSRRLADDGGELIVEALSAHGRGALEFVEQTEAGVTYAEKIDGSDRRLDPSRSAAELDRTIRGLTPHIGAYLELDGGERLGVRLAEPLDDPGVACAGDPGATAVEGERLLVGCGSGTLAIERLQPPGKREMSAGDYLRGRPAPDRVPVPR